jgi:hypothetical protein
MSCDILLEVVEGLWVSFSKLHRCVYSAFLVYCLIDAQDTCFFASSLRVIAAFLSDSCIHSFQNADWRIPKAERRLSAQSAQLSPVSFCSPLQLSCSTPRDSLDVQYTKNGESIRCHVFVQVLEMLWLLTGTRCSLTLSSSQIKLASSARVILRCPR